MIRIMAVLLLIFSTGANANQEDEIKHLLMFVATTSCTYERNGSFHNGGEARNHINKKYQYYKNKVKSTEDFIKYAATKSSISGRKYKIHCAQSATINSSDWLLEELKIYRKLR
ncbi:MAG: DUF5329 domain-containing protein [Mariprofundaceae bacterium]|nr:DUF5329 domain-containing protein [Mariprofundaceae bacterium]